MSKRYSPDHKLLVLRLFAAFNGDFAATSRFTGIPERTLRDWVVQARTAEGLPRSAIRFQPATKRR